MVVVEEVEEVVVEVEEDQGDQEAHQWCHHFHQML
jgi:hypothetical protein